MSASWVPGAEVELRRIAKQRGEEIADLHDAIEAIEERAEHDLEEVRKELRSVKRDRGATRKEVEALKLELSGVATFPTKRRASK